MNKLMVLSCLIFLFGFNNLFFAYDYPCHPPFLSSGRPYSLENSPASLFLSQNRAEIACEFAGGEYSFSHLFPWPEIEGYWHFVHKNFGGSVIFGDRYQYTIREEIEYISPQGEYLGKGYFWDSHFIYALRMGLSYQFLSHFIFGLGGDINRGVARFDIESPPGAANEYHIKYTGYSSSYCIGGAILSPRENPKLSIGYDSKVRIALRDSAGDLRYHYLIPHQLSASLSFLMGEIDLVINYYRCFGKYRDYHDTLRTIESNDLAAIFLLPVGTKTKFYFAFYSLPLSDNVSSKGFGFCFGPKLVNKGLLKEFLVVYETGTVRGGWEIPWEWGFTRYGVRLKFSL